MSGGLKRGVRLMGAGRVGRHFSVKLEKPIYGLPFKLEGVQSQKVQINHDQILNEFSSNLLKEGTEKGFIEAYLALLDAICEEDSDFIRNICEPSLANTVLSALSEIKSQQMRLIKVMPEEPPKIDVCYNSFHTHINDSLDRNLQSKGSPPVSNGPSFMQVRFRIISINLPLVVDGKAAIPMFIRIMVEFNTNVYMKLVPRTGSNQPLTEKVVPQLPQIHRLEFAASNYFKSSLMEFPGKLSQLVSANNFGEGIKVFMSGDHEWLVYDIDDHMMTDSNADADK